MSGRGCVGVRVSMAGAVTGMLTWIDIVDVYVFPNPEPTRSRVVVDAPTTTDKGLFIANTVHPRPLAREEWQRMYTKRWRRALVVVMPVAAVNGVGR